MIIDCFWAVGTFKGQKNAGVACSEESVKALIKLGCEVERGDIVFTVGDNREELIYVHHFVHVNEIHHVCPEEVFYRGKYTLEA